MKMTRNSHGFTLLEVMVALAIIGIALGAAVKASSYGAERAFGLRGRTLAGWVASNVTNEVLAARNFPDMGAHEGKAQEGTYEFGWRQEISATPNLSFRRMEVKVYLLDKPDEILAQQVTYVAKVAN